MHFMNKRIQRIVSSVLLYTNFLNIFAPVAMLVVPMESIAAQNRAVQANFSSDKGCSVPGGCLQVYRDGVLDPVQMSELSNVSLNSKQLGFLGPLSLGANYSNLTSLFFNGQYLQKIADFFAIGALGEYGEKQYRINGTAGFQFSAQGLIKLTAERFSQVLPFDFASGNINQRVNQNAYGLRMEHLVNPYFLQNINLGAYWAQAPNAPLSTVQFTSNGSNCLGYSAGFQCINERNIAGATSSGADVGASLLLTSTTQLTGNVYYDRVNYNTLFTANSIYDSQGFGGGININQLVSDRIKFGAGISTRKVYDSYNVDLSWLPPLTLVQGVEVSLFGQHVVSHNQTSNNNTAGLQIRFLPAEDNHPKPQYQIDNAVALVDVEQWVSQPAVRMSQVLAVAEQIVYLASPIILSIAPNFGPALGGNTVIISGSNFVNGLLVTFGGKLAQVLSISPTSITVIVPEAPIIKPANLPVDVVIQNPTGQNAVLPNGYTYIYDPVLITSNPNDATQDVGNTFTFTTVASNGVPPYHFQWQVSFDGGITFSNVTTGAGSMTTTYTTAPLTLADNNSFYRVTVSDTTSATYTSGALVLVVNPDPTTTTPSNAPLVIDQTASFATITSYGTLPYTYQWQISSDGGASFSNVTTGIGGTTPNYTTEMLTLADSNNQYRVVVTDAVSVSVTSGTANLTVNTDLSTTNPSDAIQDVGQSATFATTASNGTAPYSYQWQVSTNGGTSFSNVTTGAGGTSASYTTTALTIGDSGNQYRVVVTDAASASVTSGTANLTVNTDLSTTNPGNANQDVGQSATFATTASNGTAPYSYQWQVSTNGGTSFSNVTTGAGGTSASYTTLALTTADNNNKYRVVVTDAASASVTSHSANLAVNSLLTTTAPSNAIQDSGQTGTFTTTSSNGTPPYSYQWQVSSNGGTSFSNVTTGIGGNTASYTTPVLTTSDSNNQYRVVVTDAAFVSIISDAASLIVNIELSTTTPTTVITTVGSSATFTTTTSFGTPPYTYQWQVQPNGIGSFINVTTGTGGTTASYVTSALTTADNNNQYRVVVMDATLASFPSGHATLTIIPTVTSLNPNTGFVTGGNLVVITGSGFTGTVGTGSVQFGGIDAASYSVDSDTQITAFAPAALPGSVDVTVTNSGQTSAINPSDIYTYIF
jgi:hypothetical protein